MNACPRHQPKLARAYGLSLVEVMISTAVGSMVLAAVGSMTLYGARGSAALSNYTDLEAKSRYALDVVSRELRQANAMVSFQTNLPVKSFTVTNSAQAVGITLSWDSNARTVTLKRTGQAPVIALTECDQWGFSLYQRTPLLTSTNVVFYPATNGLGAPDATICKLINLSWKCSRTIAAMKINTESVQSAQIVLRNKQ
jgi:type II secretory pathway component PulJ